MSDKSHVFELPADETVPADAVREAAGGEVVYLTRNGTPVAAASQPTRPSAWRLLRTPQTRSLLAGP